MTMKRKSCLAIRNLELLNSEYGNIEVNSEVNIV